jgi:hypothetical protein
VIAISIKRALVPLCAPLLALGVSACASTASSSGFKGEQQAVAQTVAKLQSEATADEAQKICANLLASALKARLNGARGGCTQALKSQLVEIDNPELTIESVALHGATSATATVKSIHSGKSRVGTLALVKEAGKWKIAVQG